MFESDKRQNLLDLLRPPWGYRLDSAVGTTYSLDFTALTAVLLAFVDSDMELDESSIDPVNSLHAIMRLGDRVRVFVNRGQIHGPQKVSKVTLLYDRIVREIALPEGCFHPKVWVIRYCPRATPDEANLRCVTRVICSSRNLTSSQSWEAFVALDGLEGRRSGNVLLRAGVRAFLARLAIADPSATKLLKTLSKALNNTVFYLQRPFHNEAVFLWQWHKKEPLKRCLPRQCRRALLVFPFVRKRFLEDILNRAEQVVVISTQRELDAISDDAFMERLCGGRNRVFVVDPVDSEDGSSSLDLHAKILTFEGNWGTSALIGSANASESAWGGCNCEAMVKFSPAFSIDHFCDRFVYGEKPKEPGLPRPLRGWIDNYERRTYREDEEDCARRELDSICETIARWDLRMEYHPKSRSLRLFIRRPLGTTRNSLLSWAPHYALRVGLLSRLDIGAALQPLDSLPENDIHFSNVAIEDLTEFLVIEVARKKPRIERRFTIKAGADFSRWAKQRDTRLLQQMITRDNLQQFLRAILFDAALGPTAAFPDVSKSVSGGSPRSTLLSEVFIEDIIRSCTEDPTRIGEINHVIRAIEHTTAIDEGFLQFWHTFMAAEEQAEGIGSHD